MKVIQVPFSFYPDPIGGTEVYVDALSRHLGELGVEATIAAPGIRNESYLYDGVSVRRFAISKNVSDLRTIYGGGDVLAAQNFTAILDEVQPDIVHLHSFTSAVSVRLVHEINQRDIPVVFSYHTPAVTCQRGTLVRWGSKICDGVLRTQTCSRCALHGRGMNRLSAFAVGSLPVALGRLIGKIGVSGDIWTATRMTELTDFHHRTFHDFADKIDIIVAIAGWVRDVLIRNGIAPDKIILSRQDICDESLEVAGQKMIDSAPSSVLKVIFMGRIHPTKGLHLLIQALREEPSLKVTLDIFGIVQSQNEVEYEKKLHFLAKKDQRISFYPSVESKKVLQVMSQYDVLAIPSQWFETCPRVVLEAFLAGIPVMGSNLGGIAELIKDGENGLLVKFDSVKAWRDSLKRLTEDPNFSKQLKSGVRPLRRMESVAEEMFSLYQRLGRVVN